MQGGSSGRHTGNNGCATGACHTQAGRGGCGASRRYVTSSKPNRSSSLTYALGRSLLGRRAAEVNSVVVDDERETPWYALIPCVDEDEPIEIGRLVLDGEVDGVEPRLDA